MNDEVKKLAETLLEPKEDVWGERKDAAVQLASYPYDVDGFNALYSISCFPDSYALENDLYKVAAESIGKVLSERDLIEDPMKHHPLNPKYFEEFHPEALQIALSILTEAQLEQVCQYTLDHPFCAETLTRFFYHRSSKAVLEGDQTHAKIAVELFFRLKNQEKNLILYFKDIGMHIIQEKGYVTLSPLFLTLVRDYQKFNPPQTEFEKYAYFHIVLVTKLVCRDYGNLRTLISKLKEWIDSNLPQDLPYIQILELISKSDYKKADQLMQKIETKKVEDFEEQEFYFYWSLIVRWLIRDRI